MGPLTLPLAGLIYIDASGLIYSVERVEPYRTILEAMWQKAQDGDLTIVSSPLIALEALVKPLRDGNTEIELQYRELFASGAVKLLDASYQMFEDAANIRARTNLKTPARSTRQRLCTQGARSSLQTITTSDALKGCQ